jgi:hypothetical protein
MRDTNYLNMMSATFGREPAKGHGQVSPNLTYDPAQCCLTWMLQNDQFLIHIVLHPVCNVYKEKLICFLLLHDKKTSPVCISTHPSK